MYHKNKTEVGALFITDNTTLTNYTVTGLNSSTVYNVSVTANNDCGSSIIQPICWLQLQATVRRFMYCRYMIICAFKFVCHAMHVCLGSF